MSLFVCKNFSRFARIVASQSTPNLGVSTMRDVLKVVLCVLAFGMGELACDFQMQVFSHCILEWTSAQKVSQCSDIEPCDLSISERKNYSNFERDMYVFEKRSYWNRK